MSEQSYANHTRWVRGFHFVLPAILVAALVGALYVFVRRLQWGSGRTEGAVLVLLVVACAMMVWYIREFPLKAQDRAIRAEENLRHHLLTGAPLDRRLTVGQIVALRFASDEELPVLARQAAEEGMRPSAIKQAVKSWRADDHRV